MLEVVGLSVRYGDILAVDRIDLVVPDGAIVAVLGPSGSGKTSMLRAVAGLEPATVKAIRWDGQDLRDVAAHRREFGLMFQDHALFGHHDVAGNVAFGLRMHRIPRADRVTRVREMLTLVGLSGYEHRRVDELSGGERQRVGLARALAPRPRLLMLDEPLASVDQERREQLAGELHRIIRASATPTLLVTHDLDEAFTLADTVVLLDHGRVTRAGPAVDVWRNPGSIAVARFLGVATAWELPVEHGRTVTPWGPVATPTEIRTQAWVGFRPTDLRAVPDPSSSSAPSTGTGAVAGTIRTVWFRRDHFRFEIDSAHGLLTAVGTEAIAIGALVTVTADLDTAVVAPA